MRKAKLTNCEKVSQVLAAISQNLRRTMTITKNREVFDGKIGDDLSFVGQVAGDYTVMGKVKDPCAKVFLSDKQTNNMAVLFAYSDTLRNESGTQYQQKDVRIMTPEWDMNDGVVTDLTEKSQIDRLYVYHARHEKAVDVIDNLYNSVERGLTKAKISKKLKEFNLPKLKLRAVVENIMSIIDDEAEHKTSPDNTREK